MTEPKPAVTPEAALCRQPPSSRTTPQQMRIFPLRYDPFDMTSHAEFGDLKVGMTFWYKSGKTLYYKAGEFTIAIVGNFQPLTQSDPKAQYDGKTIIEEINVFDKYLDRGWGISHANFTFDRFYQAPDLDQLLNMTDERHIEGSFYNDLLVGGGSEDYILGREGNDTVWGRDGDDTIGGGHGNDYLYGGSSNDVVAGDSGNDYLDGEWGNDSLSGGGGNDALAGGGDNDILDGGFGTDRMIGGLGDDRFYVDNAGDRIFEAANQGSDIVYSSISYTLAAGQHIEMFATTSLAGTGAIHLTGNELAQRINGNNGANSLNGGGGNDTLYGFNGNDTLNGGSGADRMFGGLGNDTFRIDNAADQALESANQGTDTVFTAVNYTLAAYQHIERFGTTLLAGTGAIRLTGNELSQSINGNNGTNVISGGGGNDVLAGYAGNDTLIGGLGKDVLTGGAGNDSFRFDTALSAANVDRITDFSAPQDTIVLENAIFKGIAVGAFAATAFVKNTSGLAVDASDRIIYETDTGKLFYDSNGNAVGGSVHFATLAPNLALTNADFQVI